MVKDKARAYEVWANLTLPIMVVLSGTVGWFTARYVESGGLPVAYIFLVIFALALGIVSGIIRAILRDRARAIRMARFRRERLWSGW